MEEKIFFMNNLLINIDYCVTPWFTIKLLIFKQYLHTKGDNMKKLLGILLCVLMTSTMVSCGSKVKDETTDIVIVGGGGAGMTAAIWGLIYLRL